MRYKHNVINYKVEQMIICVSPQVNRGQVHVPQDADMMVKMEQSAQIMIK